MGDCAFDHLGLLTYIAVLLAKCVGDRQEDAPKTGPSLHVVRREVSAAVKRAPVGHKKAGERPAALSADCLHGNLIAAVDIRTLITVDLDGDEALIDYF